MTAAAPGLGRTMGIRATYRKAADFYGDFNRDGGGLLSAAIAYHLLFTLAPTLMLLVVTGRALLGQERFADRVFAYFGGLVGTELGAVLSGTVDAYLSSRADRLGAGVIGVALLLWAISGVFLQVQQAVNMMWHIRLRENLPLGRRVRLQGSRMLLVLLPVGVLALGALAWSLFSWVLELTGVDTGWVAQAFESPIAIAILVWGVVLLMYRALPYAHVTVADALVPSAVVAGVWAVGTWLFGLYLSRASTTSATAAAGSIFVLLVWLNQSARAGLLGCAACRDIAAKRGRGGPIQGAESVRPDVPKN